MCGNGPVQFVDLPAGWHVGRFDLLADLPGVQHAFSTRIGPDGASLKIDDPAGVANRQSLARAIGVQRCVTVHQVHGARVATVAEAEAGPVEADALMTDEPGVAVLGLSADCPIVLAVDPVAGAVGMAHASWRGTVAKVAAALIDGMVLSYGCEPASMRAGICPSAGPCCYEIGPDVVEIVRRELGSTGAACIVGRDGRTYLDLWSANIAQLTAAGLAAQNIAVAGVCSICDGRFFSYRREHLSAGRYGGIIARI